MKQLPRNVFALFAATLIGLAAYTYLSAQDSAPYKFQLGEDVTAAAKEKGTAIKPKLRAVADDTFAFEFDLNVKRSGQAVDGAGVIGSNTRSETWTANARLLFKEDELDGQKELRALFMYDRILFDLNDGIEGVTGYIGPQIPGEGKSKTDAHFKVKSLGGDRTPKPNIPGWIGINPSSIESERARQANAQSGHVIFNVAETGRIFNETYFADFEAPDQRNYPARLIDPLQLAMYTWPEFAADTAIKVGDTVTVKRRFPMGLLTGQALDYEFTYKLEKVYGKAEEPTAAMLSFTAKPVSGADVTQRIAGLDTSLTPPEIKDGTLLLDLVKGAPARVQWKYSARGKINEGGSANQMTFAAEVEFSASLRKQQDDKK